MIIAASDVLHVAKLAVGGGDGGSAGKDRQQSKHPHPPCGHQQVPEHRPLLPAAARHN